MPSPYRRNGDGRANRLVAVEHWGYAFGTRMADLRLYFRTVLVNSFDESAVLIDKAVFAQSHRTMHVGMPYIDGD